MKCLATVAALLMVLTASSFSASVLEERFTPWTKAVNGQVARLVFSPLYESSKPCIVWMELRNDSPRDITTLRAGPYYVAHRIDVTDKGGRSWRECGRLFKLFNSRIINGSEFVTLVPGQSVRFLSFDIRDWCPTLPPGPCTLRFEFMEHDYEFEALTTWGGSFEISADILIEASHAGEKHDTKATKADGATNPSQPVPSGTDRTSAATGSGR